MRATKQRPRTLIPNLGPSPDATIYSASLAYGFRHVTRLTGTGGEPGQRSVSVERVCTELGPSSLSMGIIMDMDQLSK